MATANSAILQLLTC